MAFPKPEWGRPPHGASAVKDHSSASNLQGWAEFEMLPGLVTDHTSPPPSPSAQLSSCLAEQQKVGRQKAEGLGPKDGATAEVGQAGGLGYLHRCPNSFAWGPRH